MKKKIKDLTYEERKEICDKYSPPCIVCPLYGNKEIVGYSHCLHDYLTSLENSSDVLETEVEVEDD